MTNAARELTNDELDLASGGASLVDIVIGIGISVAANLVYDQAKSGGVFDAISPQAAAKWLHH